MKNFITLNELTNETETITDVIKPLWFKVPIQKATNLYLDIVTDDFNSRMGRDKEKHLQCTKKEAYQKVFAIRETILKDEISQYLVAYESIYDLVSYIESITKEISSIIKSGIIKEMLKYGCTGIEPEIEEFILEDTDFNPDAVIKNVNNLCKTVCCFNMLMATMAIKLSSESLFDIYADSEKINKKLEVYYAVSRTKKRANVSNYKIDPKLLDDGIVRVMESGDHFEIHRVMARLKDKIIELKE